MNTPVQSQIRQLLYSLKNEYPFPIGIYREVNPQYDPKGGVQTVDRQRWLVRKAIVLPSLLTQSFRATVSMLATSAKFAYGNDYGINDRQVIIDGTDLPKNFKIVDNDYIIFDHKRYEIQSITELDYNLGWYLIVRENTSSVAYEIFDALLSDSINLVEEYIKT
jgi:hypothetical protein